MLFESPVCCKIWEKIEGEGPFGDIKKRSKIKNEIFEQCHSAEKCWRGPFDIFKHPLLQIIETVEGGPFGAIRKFSKKKSHGAEKILPR